MCSYTFLTIYEVDAMEKILDDKWINIEAAADYLGIKPVTLRSWIRNEKGVPAHKIGNQWVKSGESSIE